MCPPPSSPACEFYENQTDFSSISKVAVAAAEDALDTSDMLTAPLVAGNQTVPKSQISKNGKQSHFSLVVTEARCMAGIAIPMILTGLLLYSRSMISMLFLGRLGELSLAGGALAIGFANITGYSILSGLAMGMEPICGQAFGAKRYKLLGLTLQRTILLLLWTSIPIAIIWCNMEKILLFCGQDSEIASTAQSYILYSIPDLIALSILHPLRIYLRSQSITLPLTFCAALSIIFHIPINYYLVVVKNLGIKGVAISGVWTNFNIVLTLIGYVAYSGVAKRTWCRISLECLKGWKSLMQLAIPSCVSVCLEWWWYEIMILLSGFLLNPKATVASMGILIQTTALIYIFPSSLSFSVSTRVGNELGANSPKKAKLAAIIGLSSSFVLGISALFFTVMVRNIWAGMFTQDVNIIALTSMVLPIIGLCELGNCPQTTGCGVLRGTARPKLGANINLGCFYLVGMPVAIWLSFFWGFDFSGLWLGLLAAQGSCALTMLIILVKTDWELQAQRARELTATISSSFSIDQIENAGEEEECRSDDDSFDSSVYTKIDSSPV
ncbi:OLC1v1029551C1 [Oldenlandia corymbosa var. corymbosa]|uniref:Protein DETOXIFICATION n=1 Tax=Oldenlandia corymbosa var. corymbosa TaxID=529605 RepID=A0AAV1CFX3_OLDCO|nr:OLC1v1029551C1 [Oldenlandia corymbosa var. corymbosa]